MLSFFTVLIEIFSFWAASHSEAAEQEFGGCGPETADGAKERRHHFNRQSCLPG